jgi:hypothetical protein
MFDRRTVPMTRTLMKTSRIGRSLAAIVATFLLTGGIAWAGLTGVVTAVSRHDVTVSGAVYAIEEGTSIEDMSGHPITLPELRPGIAVELDFDDAGHLTTIRAAVVR